MKNFSPEKVSDIMAYIDSKKLTEDELCCLSQFLEEYMDDRTNNIK